MINLYAEARTLTDVVGRINYATNLESQGEKLVMVAGNMDLVMWKQLANTCRVTFKPRKMLADVRQKDGNLKKELVDDKCCEAREIIVQLPNNFLHFPQSYQKKLMERLAVFIKTQTGTENVIALHDSHAGRDGEANVHVHIIFAERIALRQPIDVYAERNLFYDESGKRVYKKTEILDGAGQLRAGCRIAPKGTLRYTKYFGTQIEAFKNPIWLDGVKHRLCDWVNTELRPDELRQVYDPSGPYLAQHHIGKPRYDSSGELVGEQEMISRWNKNVIVFNKCVRAGVIKLKEAQDYKTQLSLAPGFFAQCDELEEILSHSELQHFSRSDLDRATYAELELSISQSEMLPRCFEGEDEKKKQLLRQLYRQSHLTWQAYRAEIDFTRKALLSRQAREISASIEQLRAELGYDSYPTTYRRKQAVMGVAGQVWELSVGRQDAKADALNARAIAYQELCTRRDRLKMLRCQTVEEKRGGRRRDRKAEARRKKERMEMIELSKELLGDAVKEYKAAKKTYKIYTGTERLLAEYRAYALQVAADEELSDYEAERARNKYLAAARRLQEPNEKILREMEKHLDDLKKSQAIRKERNQNTAKNETAIPVQHDETEKQKCFADDKER